MVLTTNNWLPVLLKPDHRLHIFIVYYVSLFMMAINQMPQVKKAQAVEAPATTLSPFTDNNEDRLPYRSHRSLAFAAADKIHPPRVAEVTAQEAVNVGLEEANKITSSTYAGKHN